MIGPDGPSHHGCQRDPRLVGDGGQPAAARHDQRHPERRRRRTGAPPTSAPAAARPARRRSGSVGQRRRRRRSTRSSLAGRAVDRRDEPAPVRGAQRLGDQCGLVDAARSGPAHGRPPAARRRRRRAPLRPRAGRPPAPGRRARDRPCSRLKVATRTAPTLADRPAPTEPGRRVRRMSPAPTTSTRPRRPRRGRRRRRRLRSPAWSSGCASRRSPATRRTTTTYAARPTDSRSALRDTGFPTVEVWETDGLPAVFAEWPSDDPDAPTALVYGHHDVQPVTPLDLWEHPPFEPTVDGDRLLRPRRGRRQGPGLLPHARAARSPRGDRPDQPGREPQADRRGRGGVRLAATSRPAARAARPARLRRRRRVGHRHVGARGVRRCAPACAA